MVKREVDFDSSRPSFRFILKKLNGSQLSDKEIETIISDMDSGFLSETDIAYFVSSISKHGMTFSETKSLTKALAHSGKVMNWSSKIIADKHCVGGIPGNRTTPIVVAICAAAGLKMPKTSSRSITSAAGTADTIEVMANVSLSVDKIKKVVDKTGACMVWGGSLGLAPADERLLEIERKMNMDPGPQIIASILSKKLAAGSTHILIDIPVGPGAKFSKSQGKSFSKLFYKIARSFKVKLEIVFTDGSQPIGKGIGPTLEMIDVLKVLKQEEKIKDLEEKSLFLAGKILEMTGKERKGKGYSKAMEILYSGKALDKFNEILKEQGLLKNPKIHSGKYSYSILANKNIKIRSWHNKELNNLAKVLGCPNIKTAGVLIHGHNRDKIRKGSPIFTMYSDDKVKLINGKKFLKENKVVSF